MAVANGLHVLDCHHHVGSHNAVTRGTSSAGTAPEDESRGQQELDARVAMMDAIGVEQAIIMPGHAYLRPAGQADTMRVNDRIAAYRDANPERFPAALGIVEPLHGRASFDELRRIKDELGLVGVSFHVRFQGVTTNSSYVISLVREMEKLELFAYIHSLAVVVDEAWWKVQDLAESIPDTPILAINAFTTSEHSREALRVAENTPNIHFDLSGMPNLNNAMPVIETVGPERVVFGTNTYSTVNAPPPQVRNTVIDALVATDRLGEDAKRLIFDGNIRRLLKLDQS